MSDDDAPRESPVQTAMDVAVTVLLVVGPLLGFVVFLALAFFGLLMVACTTGGCL
jgi:hypothetical protein